MKAVVLRRFGDPDVLSYEDIALPVVGAGEVLVRVEAVTVNQTLDLMIRAGRGRDIQLPRVLGVDPTGVVEAVGGNVRSVRVGDRVAVTTTIRCGNCAACREGREDDCSNARQIGVHRDGGYAEYVAVPETNILGVPAGLDPVTAAIVMRHFPTAFNLLLSKAQLREGETVLITGASGGLGSAGIQVAKRLGAVVIAGAGSDERLAAAISVGADFGVQYRAESLRAAVARLTDGRGVDVVMENTGEPTVWSEAFAALAHSGRLVTSAAHGGGHVELDLKQLYRRRLRVIGGSGYTDQDLVSTVEAAADGNLRVIVGRVLPLADATTAHKLAESRSVTGKIVLTP